MNVDNWVKIGNHIINLSQVLHVRVETQECTVVFATRDLRFIGTEARAFLEIFIGVKTAKDR